MPATCNIKASSKNFEIRFATGCTCDERRFRVESLIRHDASLRMDNRYGQLNPQVDFSGFKPGHWRGRGYISDKLMCPNMRYSERTRGASSGG